ncbi:MAG: aldehyde ferredoxin oxidoreductase family protein [Desulfamplus sp.]|nr:aldehyde ferredoxin oxidoreductase family protein [Desulfamplus sp.]
MEEIKGFSNKILEINLTDKSWSISEASIKDREMYIGGKGLGMKLLYDRLKPGVDPLGEDNILIIMPGVMTGTGAPCSGRFEAIAKSPLTGIIATASCGGPFGIQLKTAGYGGLVIRGKSAHRCVLWFDHETVEFRDASDLWGLDTAETQKLLLASSTVKNTKSNLLDSGKVESADSKKEAILAIGPAGENLVRFANIASGHRFLGRGGLGAVMGSKNLKAIVAKGSHYKIVPVDSELFERLKKKANLFIKREAVTISMGKVGTATNVKFVNKAKMLPVWNYSFGEHDQAFRISGEMIKEKHDTKLNTCKPCSIMCGHKGKFNGKDAPVPEYETLTLLGSNLGIFDRDAISRFNDICNRGGMDTISAGGTLAWVMEAVEKGLVPHDVFAYPDNSHQVASDGLQQSESDKSAQYPLMFGSPCGIEEALESITKAEGFGKEMGLGSRALSQKYGGKEFAIQVKGLEMAGYDPRGSYGLGLAYAVANRGACHLSASLMAFEVFLGLLKPDTARAKPQFVKFVEDLTCSINALQTCHFTMYAYTLEPMLTKYTPKFVLKNLMLWLPEVALALFDFSIYPAFFSAITGIKMSSGDFIKAGERIHVLERYMNTREGIRSRDDALPERMVMETIIGDDKKRIVPLKEMLKKYYKLRGYNSDGIPVAKLFEQLQIPSEPCSIS